MYIVKNSLKNLMRNGGRNSIIWLLSLLTLTSVILSFSIRGNSLLAIERYKDRFGIQATLEFDWEKLEKDFPPKETVNEDGSITQESTFEVPPVSLEEYLSYADSPYVKKAIFSTICGFASEELTRVPDNLHENEEFIDLNGMSLEELKKFFQVDTEAEVAEQLGGEESLKEVLDSKSGMAGHLWGYSDYSDLSHLGAFARGENKLEEGDFPADKYECIVSSAYAEHNHLKIGDVISLSGPGKTEDTEEISFKITGIYGAHMNEAYAVPVGDLYGYVYTTFDTVVESGFHWVYVDNVVFELKDPDGAAMFAQELYEKGMSPYRTLIYSTEEYDNHIGPLKNISRIAGLFTLTAGIIGAAVLFLVSLISVRERKYEIGVLRSMGMKKGGIARGMIYEALILTAGAFAVSTLAGMILTKPMAAWLLGGLAEEAGIFPVTAALLGGAAAFGLSVIAGVCAVFMVMRQEPMKILAERS